MYLVVRVLLAVLVAVVARHDCADAGANIVPEIPAFHLGSCGAVTGAPACMWDCDAARPCCDNGTTCEHSGCERDVVDAFSAHLVVRATDCPSGGGAVFEFGLRGIKRDGSAIVVPSRTIDLCTADVQCGAFRNCPACTDDGCAPVCEDPEAICPPIPPQPSFFCENPGGGGRPGGGRPESCRDPSGSDQLPSPGRRFCEADIVDILEPATGVTRFERWLRLQPLLQAIQEDLRTHYPEADGPAIILTTDRRSGQAPPGTTCSQPDPNDGRLGCCVTSLPNGGSETSCCVTVGLLRNPRMTAVPEAVASAAVGLSPLSVTANSCVPLCGNGRRDPGEECDLADDSSCPGQCLPIGHQEACKCNRPPHCDGALIRPQVLWPPNRKFVSVVIEGIADPDGDPVVLSVTSVRQDEPVRDRRVGQDACPDAQVSDGGALLLRAERSAAADGRLYRVGFLAEDPHGLRCTGTLDACVPHDRSKSTGCLDDGRHVDSTSCAQ